MRWKSRSGLGCVVGAVLVAILSGPAPAGAADSPILRFDSSSNIEIDLHRVVEDLTPLLVPPDLGDSTATAAAAFLDLLGIPSLDRLTYDTRTSLQDLEAHLAVTLDRSRTTGLLGALADVPPGRFRFGSYLRGDEVAAVFSRPNGAGDLRTLSAFMNRPDVQDLLSKGPVAELTFLTLWHSQIESQILPLLSGELDVAVLTPRPDAEDHNPTVIVALGVEDATAFRDELLDALGSTMGTDTVARMRAMPGTKAGEFTLYPLMNDYFYAMGPGFFVVAADSARLAETVGRKAPGKDGLPEVTGRTYVRVNADLAFPLLASLGDGGGPAGAGMDSVLAVLRTSAGGRLGVFEMTGTAGSNRFEMNFHGPGSLLSAEYGFLEAAMRRSLEARAAGIKLGRLRQAVSTVDQAMTAYGSQHGGLYPEKLEQLVEEGYLAALPDLIPTPPGRYVDGGYSYIPLRNDDGWVDGYFYFVYGGGKGTGYDVFTPDNSGTPAHFEVASDGKEDGVPAFAYDGSAGDQIEAWRQGR